MHVLCACELFLKRSNDLAVHFFIVIGKGTTDACYKNKYANEDLVFHDAIFCLFLLKMGIVMYPGYVDTIARF
jgi:hypothetical protein